MVDLGRLAVSHEPCGWSGAWDDLWDESIHPCAAEMNKKILKGLFQPWVYISGALDLVDPED